MERGKAEARNNVQHKTVISKVLTQLFSKTNLAFDFALRCKCNSVMKFAM